MCRRAAIWTARAGTQGGRPGAAAVPVREGHLPARELDGGLHAVVGVCGGVDAAAGAGAAAREQPQHAAAPGRAVCGILRGDTDRTAADADAGDIREAVSRQLPALVRAERRDPVGHALHVPANNDYIRQFDVGANRALHAAQLPEDNPSLGAPLA